MTRRKETAQGGAGEKVPDDEIPNEPQLKTGGSASEAAGATEEQQIMQDVPSARFDELPEPGENTPDPRNLSLVMEIPVTCSVELGRTRIRIADLLKLARGSVVEVDRPAGEPLDLRVNGCLVAHGEVVVVNDKFGIRLLDIVGRAERLKSVS